MKVLAGVVALGVVALLTVPLLLMGGGVPVQAFASPCAPPVSLTAEVEQQAGGGSGPAALTARQAANARVIIAVGKARGVPRRGWIIAIATSLQEARLLNYANSSVPISLTYPHQAVGSDHDSVGLFQQRRAAGWGSIKELMNPVYAATAFYGGPDVPPTNGGLLDLPGWQDLPVTVAAQSVQGSAFPDAYADDAEHAARIVATLAPGTDPIEGLAPLTRQPGGQQQCDWQTQLGPQASTLPLGAPGQWVSPVTGTLTSGFGSRWGSVHDGADIAGPIGTPIRAATSGVVIAAGPAGGYGLWVRIRHPGNVVTEYGHLHEVRVSEGQRVRTGQVIATRGNRGQSTGPHLHFEVQPGGDSVDPVAWYHSKGLTLAGNPAGAA